ncbi:MAG: ATP-grasp domain-containing protein [Nitrospirae bacterium]|nr:ATP-grasp domain-containing protein [Nitrospirota bacterium]
MGLGGVPVVVATREPENPVLASRYCRGCIALPGAPCHPQYEQVLLAAGKRLAELAGRRVPLFFGTDDELWFLYRRQEALSRYYSMLLNDRELGLALLDKTRFERLARECDLPIPRSYSWDGGDGPPVAEAPGPVIVKPKTKDDWNVSPVYRALLAERGKAMVFASPRELLAHAAACEFKDMLTVQDYIPGDDNQIFSYHGFANEHGRVLASFMGRKLRTFPRYTGESSYIEIVSGPHDFETLACGIVERLGLKGVFKMDFKRDMRNGRFYLLEINARFNLWHHLGAVNGVNLPAVAYDYLVNDDRRVRRARVAPTYRWLNFSLDYRAFRDGWRHGGPGLWAWMRSLFGSRKVYRLFSLRDPLPFVSRYVPFLARRRWLWRPTA